MNELEALRSVAQILARVATPIERQNIARRVAQKTKGDDSEIALSLPHAAALFWPGDAEKTAEVLRQITLAFDAGELGGFLPREHRHILFTELTVWPDCPPMAADSPLRHWVPDAPAKPQAAPVVNTKAKPRTWWEISSAYIVEVMQAGQYATAKELYRALEAKAGPNAPFDKGTGASRGSLFVREIAQPLSLKTVQNNWPALRELAKK